MIRAAVHIHSTWSYDGKLGLEELASLFAGRGVEALLITEHDRGFSDSRVAEHREACERASTSEIRLIPGIEYSDPANRVHILVWGNVPFLGEGRTTTELLKEVKRANGIAVMAHPSRREAWQCFDPEWREYLAGVEIWNRKTDGWAPSRTAPKLVENWPGLRFVGMDFHTRKQLFPLTMALETSRPVSETVVLDCIRAGACHPCAFGFPLVGGMRPRAWQAFDLAERCRQLLARLVRKARMARASRREVGMGETL